MFLEHTEPYLMLERAKKLSEAKAWLYAFSSDKGLQDKILKRIKRRLFDYGTDERNIIIGTYKITTQAIDPEKVAGSPYTLKDSGKFYNSMYTGVFEDYFFIDADAQKGRENLFKKYGDGIIGLTDEDKEWLVKELIDSYLEYVEKVLFND